MHSPWMQKFLYSISQGVPFFLFFPLFFFLLDLPAFFSPPLFAGLGLTTGSTEKRTWRLRIKVLESTILRKLNWRIWWEPGGPPPWENLWPGSRGCKWECCWASHTQHKGSKLSSSLKHNSATLKSCAMQTRARRAKSHQRQRAAEMQDCSIS